MGGDRENEVGICDRERKEECGLKTKKDEELESWRVETVEKRKVWHTSGKIEDISYFLEKGKVV